MFGWKTVKNWLLMLGIIPLNIVWVFILGQVGTHWPSFLPNWLWRLFGSCWIVAYLYIFWRLCKPALKKLWDDIRKIGDVK